MILILGKEGVLHMAGKEIQNFFQNLFKQRGKWRRKAAELDGDYQEDKPRAVNKRKQIIFMCDGRMHAGGLADRLRGIVSSYYVCKKLGYDFRIYFVHPFCLSDYLEPNKVDWRISQEELSFCSLDAKPMFCGSNGTFVERSFQEAWLKKNFREANKQLHVYTNAILLPRGDGFSKLFNELFRPSRSLEKALMKYHSEIGSSYNSVTLRFQQLLGDFKEGNYPILKEQQQEILIEKCLEKISEIYYKYRMKNRLLVTSDSCRFLEIAAQRFNFVYIVSGKLAHMDWTSDIPFEYNLKTFVDFLMISRAEKVFLLQTEGMYNSGFPRRAAQINNRPFKHIRF